MTRSVYVLVPTTITDAMLTSCTIAEPSASETAWVSAASYTLGDVVIRTTTHRKYEALITHTGVTTLPEDDEVNWLDIGPTARWAAFDGETSTASEGATPVTYVAEPGNFDAISFYGLEGSGIDVSVLDASGGTEVYSYTGDLQVLPLDWWDWFFGEIRQLTKLVLSDIPPYPTAEVTITITGSTTASVGMIAIGDYRSLIGDYTWGGPLHGASAEPKSFSQITTASDGTTRIRRGRSATDMRVRVVVPREAADYCLATLQDVLDVPCACIASTAQGYEGLNVFGLLNGSLVYDNNGHALLSLYQKGLV